MGNSKTKTPARIEGENLCRKFPNAPDMQLARMLYKSFNQQLKDVETARAYIRTIRGHIGKNNRERTKDKSLYKPILRDTNSNKIPPPRIELPESFANDYSPFVIKQSRILVISDLHIPYHDNDAIRLALQYGIEKNVTCILINGDLMDMPAFSRFEKDWRMRTAGEEFEATRQFLRELRRLFPKAKIVYKEGNHCFSKNTEVLTNNGFKLFRDLDDTDLVAQFDDVKNISFAKPLEIIKKNYNGDIYSIESNYTKQVVTDGHDVVINSEKVKAKDVKVSDIKNIPTSGELNNKEYDISDDMLRFLVWVVCDGCIFTTKIINNTKTRIQFKLSKERKLVRIKELLDNINAPYTFKEATKSGLNNLQPYMFRIYKKEFVNPLLSLLGNKKEFPLWFRKLSKRQVEVVIDEIAVTDGSLSKEGRISWVTTNKHDSDLIQEICVCNGIDVNISMYNNQGGFENGLPQYTSRIQKNKKETNLSMKSIKVENYVDDVFCVSMPLGTVITRIDGKVGFSGNCERWERWLYNKAPEIFGDTEFRLDVRLRLGELGIDHVNDKKIVKLGKLSVLHGHEMAGGAGGVNPSRSTFLKTTSNVLVGHFHKTSNHTETTMDGNIISVNSTGCLCGLNPLYMPINRHNLGFAYVECDIESGEYQIDNLKIIKGKIYH